MFSAVPMLAAVSASATEAPPCSSPIGWMVFGPTGIVQTTRQGVNSLLVIPTAPTIIFSGSIPFNKLPYPIFLPLIYMHLFFINELSLLEKRRLKHYGFLYAELSITITQPDRKEIYLPVLLPD